MDYPSMSLHDFLQKAAHRYPERAAIVYYDESPESVASVVTYGELDTKSDRFASGLMDLGIAKGDRVAYFLQNSPELIIAFYGVLKAGAVPVPCNPMYRINELVYQLEDSGATAVFCDSDLYPLVKQAKDSVQLTHIIVVGDSDGGLSYDGFVKPHDSPANLPVIDPDEDLALLPYTGGTTGVPKGVMLTHRNLVVDAIQFAHWYGYVEGEEVFIVALPLFHQGGIVGAMSVPISVAGTMVLFRRFNPGTVLKAIETHNATRLLGVPTMYSAYLNLEDANSYDLSSLRHSRSGAAPLPAAVKEAFDKLVGHEVLIEGYALTEMGPLTHANPIHRAKAGSIGIPMPDTETRVVDPDDGTLETPIGEVGELLMRGPQLMKGYWNRPEETADAIREEWLYTGDLVRMDEEGYFFIVDRKKDVINAAGFKVWPREVEDLLYQHEFVKLVAVVPEPDPYRGETVKAVVVLKDGHPGAREEEIRQELIALCRQELAAYKVPRIMEFQESLPISAAGKVLRRSLWKTQTPT